MEILIVVLLLGGIVLLLAPRLRNRRGMGGPGANMAQGTLLVTGVSAGADSNGSQNVTIAGVINGPTVSEHETYAQMVMTVGTAPATGQLIPIVYSPKNPDKWGFAPPGMSGPARQPEPKTELY